MDCQYLDFAKFDSNPGVYGAGNRRDLVTSRNTYKKSLAPNITQQYTNYQGIKGSFYVNDNPAKIQQRGAEHIDEASENKQIQQCVYKESTMQQTNERLHNQIQKLKKKLEKQQQAQQQQINNQLFIGILIAIAVVVANIMIINNIKQSLYRKLDRLDNRQ